MYYVWVPMSTHSREAHDWDSFVDAQATRVLNLTGTWRCDDGGRYYIRQIGNQVWWTGLSDNGGGQTFTNVFHGTLRYDPISRATDIYGSWADVPRGRILQSGTLRLNLMSSDGFVKVSETGGFGGRIWSRL